MSVSGNVSTARDLTLGKLLKIFSTNGVYNQFSTESELWDLMLKKRVAKPEGGELRYNLRTDRGQTAAQMLAPGAEGSYPIAARSAHSEATAYFKEFGATIDVPNHLLNKTGSELAAYAQDIMGEELDMKAQAIARMLSRQLCGDGTGCLGIIGSVVESGTTIVVTLSTTSANAGRSHVGNFEIGERYVIADADGALDVSTTGGEEYFICTDIDEENDQVTLQGYDSSDAVVDPGGLGNIDADDFIYPYGDGAETHVPVIASISDYNRASFSLVGLESLAADDGRTVNGLTMTGNLKGSRIDAGGDAIDRTHLQSLLSKIKRKVGKGRYKYNKVLMFDTVYDALMESWETDRQIISVQDNKRGAPTLGFLHHKDKLEFTPDEFVPKQRLWVVPEGDVLQFRGTDIEQVDDDGSKFRRPVDSSGNFKRVLQAHLEGSGLLFATHPAAIGCVENFTV